MSEIWLTKKDYVSQTGKTPRQVDYLCNKGDIEDNGKAGLDRRFKFVDRKAAPEQFMGDLKDKHLEIKIKREQQLLYDQRLLLAEKIKDIFIHEYHNRRIAALTEIVRKHGSRELIKAWNQEIISGSTENLPKLQEALREVILN